MVNHDGADHLRIIPVIDILNGVVVHAVKGRRSEYQPLNSTICNSVNPLEVALAFKTGGFDELYVADLDSILHKGTNAQAISQIASITGLRLMVDAGVADLQEAHKLSLTQVSKVIVGTETLRSFNFIREAIEHFGSQVVFSLDLKNGKLLTKSEDVASMDFFALLQELRELGAAELIVLDLDRVGSGEGVDFGLLKKIRGHFKRSLLVGGGVRNIDDLLKLKEMGIDGVLLATALHSGKISIEALHKSGLL
jgi:phosphoribosylformimino-5-aminoimidazole carboxamide ribotide isomerase